MNKELLLKTAGAIEANPEHFSMGSWFSNAYCGTTACIAGWSIHLHTKKDFDSLYDDWDYGRFNPEVKATKILGLSFKEARSLFYRTFWCNDQLRAKFGFTKNPIEKAEIAAEYVRWFVKTDGGTNV